MQSPDGHLYGTYGVSGGSAIFNKQDYSGNATNLYKFSPSEGVPYLLFLGMSDDFYGVSVMPSNMGNAGIFRLTPAGSISWIVPSMPLAGAGSYSVSLIEATDGNFYGTQPEGGSADAGTIYQVTPPGAVKTLYEFSNPQTGIPETLLQASDGMLYGTARGEYNTGFHGYSSVFRLDPTTGAFQTIYSFKNLSLGECQCRILISSVAATIAAAIMFISRMAFWFGGSSDDDDRGGGNAIAGFLMMILGPIAAMLIQMAISRSREYSADEASAQYTHQPGELISALGKLDTYSKRIPMEASPSTAHLYIIKPFTGQWFMNLFSTHPSTEDRIARLQQMR